LPRLLRGTTILLSIHDALLANSSEKRDFPPCDSPLKSPMALLTHLPQAIYILSICDHLLAFPATLAEVYASKVRRRSRIWWVVLVDNRKNLDVLGCEGVLCRYRLESVNVTRVSLAEKPDGSVNTSLGVCHCMCRRSMIKSRPGARCADRKHSTFARQMGFVSAIKGVWAWYQTIATSLLLSKMWTSR